MQLASERRAAILRAAHLRGSVRVAELSEQLGVSTVTIRRDVTALVDEGVLERVHGGAVLAARADPGARRTGAPKIRATLGMVVPSATYYYPGVIQGAEAASARLGVRLILAITNYFPEEDRRQVGRLLELGVDGLLLTTSFAADEDPEISAWAAGIPVPTVLVERQADISAARRLEHVRTDHAAGAQLAIHHLAQLGHERVALAVRKDSPTTRWLIEGHAAAVARGVIARNGLEPTMLSRHDSDPVERERIMTDLLDQCRDHGARALLVHNDEDALLICRLAAAQGLRVPDDLAVIAYDDEVAGLADVPLTAVAPPKRDVGSLAVEMVMQRLARGTEQAAQHVSLLPQLVVRASCGGA